MMNARARLCWVAGTCFYANDKVEILNIFEGSMRSLDAFNARLRSLLKEAHEHASSA